MQHSDNGRLGHHVTDLLNAAVDDSFMQHAKLEELALGRRTRRKREGGGMGREEGR